MVTPLFPDVAPIEPGAWLKETLEQNSHLVARSEKARSELILMPILLDLVVSNQYAFAIFSGESLEADPSQGLNGECDFILGKDQTSYTIQSPIFALIEVRQNIVESSLGQCVAQMVGAWVFNQAEGTPVAAIYGCVSNVAEWQFLKLENKLLSIDERVYFFNELPVILGVLQQIIWQGLS